MVTEAETGVTRPPACSAKVASNTRNVPFHSPRRNQLANNSVSNF